MYAAQGDPRQVGHGRAGAGGYHQAVIRECIARVSDDPLTLTVDLRNALAKAQGHALPGKGLWVLQGQGLLLQFTG